MISALLAATVLVLVVCVIVLFARERGPGPADIAVSYELAWDRLDFGALWSLSGAELRDGMNRKEYVAAKTHAYAGRGELGHVAEIVTVEHAETGHDDAEVRTCVTMANGDVVRNDLTFARRASSWVVTGYALAPLPPPVG